MTLQKLLKLLRAKHPQDYDKDIFPALLIYDDGSGMILKNTTKIDYFGFHNQSNVLYSFTSVMDLVRYLES